MVVLHLLSGAEAGKRFETAQFPLTVGRSRESAFSLKEPGVFDDHFEIHFGEDGYSLKLKPPATLSINGTPSQGAILRNGDLIQAGYAKLQFWLGPLQQKGLKFREVGTMLLIAAVAVAQIYFLVRLVEMAR